MKSKFKKLIIIILAVLLLVVGYFAFLQKPETAAADWFDESWLFRQIIVITNSGLAQTDFQVQLTIDTATLITATKMQSDCDDIRLTDLNGKLLDHWIEPTTCNTSTTKVWVKIPSIPATIGASIYLYYGNSAAVSTSSTANTFIREISGVQGAWDMDEASWTNDCSTNTALDASGNANHGKSCPNAGGTQPAAAKFGNGGIFDGSDDYVDAGNGASLGITSSFTAGGWMKIEDSQGNALVGKDQFVAGNRGWYFSTVATTRQLRLLVSSDGTAVQYLTTTNSLNLSEWYYLVGAYNALTQTLKIYVNGAEWTGTNSGSVPTSIYNSSLNVLIGSSNSYTNGLIDDVKIFNYALTAEQVKMEYNGGAVNFW